MKYVIIFIILVSMVVSFTTILSELHSPKSKSTHSFSVGKKNLGNTLVEVSDSIHLN